MGLLSVNPMGGPISGYPLYTQSICITIIQCWTDVEDVGPTLYKCYTNILSLLGSLYETAKTCVRVQTSFSVLRA